MLKMSVLVIIVKVLLAEVVGGVNMLLIVKLNSVPLGAVLIKLFKSMILDELVISKTQFKFEFKKFAVDNLVHVLLSVEINGEYVEFA
jgi:hypothetical protein